MKKLKHVIRLLYLTLLLLMAAFGIGFSNSLTGNKEQYMNREIRTEQTEKRHEDDEDDEIT